MQPDALRFVIKAGGFVVLGSLIGLGAFTFTYARGYSYLGNDSSSCANCHVMNDQYDGWVKSSHQDVAGCNDCHSAPGVVGKYLSKSINGFNHSWAMTTGRFDEPIRIREWNRSITEQACAECHSDVFHNQSAVTDCTRCHSTVGHE